MFRWIFGKPVASEEVDDHERRIGARDSNSYDSHFDFGLSDRSVREREQRDRDDAFRRQEEDRCRREEERRRQESESQFTQY